MKTLLAAPISLAALALVASVSTAVVHKDTILWGDHVLIHVGSQGIDLADCQSFVFTICPPAAS